MLFRSQARQGNWSRYVYTHENPYRVDAFGEIQDNLGDPQYWKLLGQLWVGSENIWQNLDDWKELLANETRNLKLRPLMMDRQERRVLKNLAEPIPIYRGCREHNREGLSWTLDYDQAEWFAKRFSPKGSVEEREITKDQAIAYFSREREIVIDPSVFDR